MSCSCIDCTWRAGQIILRRDSNLSHSCCAAWCKFPAACKAPTGVQVLACALQSLKLAITNALLT